LGEQALGFLALKFLEVIRVLARVTVLIFASSEEQYDSKERVLHMPSF
jgi:GDP-D-mannose dehydratase